jgi:hypothetical protein
MFTRATRDFGVWRESHPSRRRYAGRPTSNFVFALWVSAFVAWIIFVILFRMRSEFFLVESLLIPLNKVDEAPAKLLPSRSAAMSLALVADRRAAGDVRLIFSDGSSFLLGKDESSLRGYLAEKMDSIEYQAMLAMRIDPAATRIQIWPEAGLDSVVLRRAVNLFATQGFDDFDIAVQPEKRSHE